MGLQTLYFLFASGRWLIVEKLWRVFFCPGIAQFYICSISRTFVRIWPLASCGGIVKKNFFQNVLDKALALGYNGSDGLFCFTPVFLVAR